MKISDDADPNQPDIDEMGEWEQAKRPAGGRRRRLDSMISVRLAPSEVAEVRAAAARHGLTVSEFIRRASLAAASESVAPVQTYNRVTYGLSSGLTTNSRVLSGLVVPELLPLA